MTEIYNPDNDVPYYSVILKDVRHNQLFKKIFFISNVPEKILQITTRVKDFHILFIISNLKMSLFWDIKLITLVVNKVLILSKFLLFLSLHKLSLWHRILLIPIHKHLRNVFAHYGVLLIPPPPPCPKALLPCLTTQLNSLFISKSHYSYPHLLIT